jgi:hypothetical protein
VFRLWVQSLIKVLEIDALGGVGTVGAAINFDSFSGRTFGPVMSLLRMMGASRLGSDRRRTKKFTVKPNQGVTELSQLIEDRYVRCAPNLRQWRGST